MVSPSLGINSELIISEVITDEFELQAPLILDNRDISTESQQYMIRILLQMQYN